MASLNAFVRSPKANAVLDRLIQVALPAVVLIDAAVMLLGSHEFVASSPITSFLFNGAYGLAAIAAYRTSRRVGAAASAWLALSAAMGAYLAGNLYSLHFVAWDQYPSFADALWLSSYGFAAAALVLLARSSISGVTRSAMLDGAIAGVAMAAGATTLVIGNLIRGGEGGFAIVVTNVAYPIADLLLLGVLVTTTKLVSRVDRERVLLAVGFTLLLAGDSLFLWRMAHDAWVPHTAPELFFVGSAVVLGMAATVARPREPIAAAAPHFLVPAFGAVACVGLLVWGDFARTGPVAIGLDLTLAVLVGIRVSYGVHDLRTRAAQVEASPTRLAEMEELRYALSDGQIVAPFQPQVDLRTNQVIAAEVLARWVHPSRGIVCPADFLPLVAEGGMTARLTEAMLSQASKARATCALSGHPVSLSVNLSTPELTDPELVVNVAELAGWTTGTLCSLTLEITEESVISDPVHVRAVLTELRQLGVRISVDDYGTGHASLAYLRDLPLDEVKLDRSFVHGACHDERSAAIAASTVELAHELDLSIVAEGIEDAETDSWLRSLGCDIGQGFFHARPMPLDALIDWLEARDAAAAG